MQKERGLLVNDLLLSFRILKNPGDAQSSGFLNGSSFHDVELKSHLAAINRFCAADISLSFLYLSPCQQVSLIIKRQCCRCIHCRDAGILSCQDILVVGL